MTALAFGVANLVIFGWLWYFSNISSPAILSNPKVLSASELCPGDLLIYSFVIDTKRTVEVDINIYIRSDFLNIRSPVADQISYQIEGNSQINATRQWTVPPYWGNPEVPSPAKWDPGPYHLEIIYHVSGYGPGEDPLTIPFSISRNCIEVREHRFPSNKMYGYADNEIRK
jgi:hypothetical protein